MYYFLKTFHHRAGFWTRHSGTDASGQARSDAPARGPGAGVLGADRHLQQSGWKASGRWKRDDSRPLPRSPVRRRHRSPAAQLLGERRPKDRVQPKAQRAQHRVDDGAVGLLPGSGPGRPHVLGPGGRERGWSAPPQHPRNIHAALLLEGRSRRSRFRPLPGTACPEHRGQERQVGPGPAGASGFPEEVSESADAAGRRTRRSSAERVPCRTRILLAGGDW